MNLCVDIGNSRIKAGLFKYGELIDVKIARQKFDIELINHWHSSLKFDRIFISSVRNIKDETMNVISNSYDVIVADTSMKLPINIDYETPETLGIDRLFGAIGAQSLFPNRPTLSIDAGTCITYDVVNGSNTFIGGAISPGIQMKLNALHKFTGRLPQLNFSGEAVTFGVSTASSMFKGTSQASISEMDAIINEMKDKFEGIKVLITGGDASFFEQHAENAIFAAPNLVLLGMNTSLEHFLNH